MSFSPDPSARASDPAVSVWVAANAGAGKTYTLANRVARLLLAGTQPQRILCLTFTKAAAAEMQDRLFRQLGDWAMLDDAALAQRITAIGGAAALADETGLAKARRLFAQALETPGGLKILTIHAFCQQVLARFPIEAGIAPAFEVLDEQSARALAAEARTSVLERAGSGEPLLAAAVTHLVGEAGESALTTILDRSDRRRLDRFFDALADGELGRAVRQAHGAPEESADTVARSFCGELKREIDELKAARDALAQGSANDIKQAARLSAFIVADFGEGAFTLMLDAMLTKEGEPRASLMTRKLADKMGAQLAYLQSLQGRVCDVAERWRAARAAALAQAALTLLAAARTAYAAAKRLAGVLDYDDLILATRNLLERQGAAQWVLYKLDNGIDHVLVDEAQDTSPEQWAILRKLTEDFFSGASNAKTVRTLFAVGDEKQSIFSFQGADPAQFAVNRGHFATLALGAGLEFRDQTLETSRRSVPEILRFVDAVFDSEAAREGVTFGNAPLKHRAHRTEATGGIEVWPPLPPQDREEGDIYRPVDALGAQGPVAALAAKIAGRIKDWLDSAAALPGHDAPIAPKDIMILLPRREPFGSEVIRQLKLRGVPVAGADRVILTEQIATMDLMALGRFALQRQDDLTLAALLRSPLCGLSEEALFALAHDRKGDLWSALVAAQGEPQIAPLHAFLAEMLALADYAPPFEFYSHALSARGGKEKLLARLGPEAADAIGEFISLALAHERNATPSLEGFLDWLAHGGTEIKRDMERGRDEVRVMTVHGAKGLEADIVFLPDTTALREPESGNLLHDGEAVLFAAAGARAPARVKTAQAAAKAQWRKEHRRLLYVALTRARDRLIVCGFENRHGTKDGSWHDLAARAATALGMQPTPDGLGFGALAMTTGTRGAADAAAAALPAWLYRPPPPEPRTPRLIRPSDAVDTTPAPSPLGDGAARFLRGNVIHALLARLPELPRAQWQAKARAYGLARGIVAAQADALALEVMAVLDEPAFAAAFGPDSLAEAGLVAELPELGQRINGRIDRLAVTADEVLILDFKTNRPPPAREEEVAPVYLAQMTLYRAGAAKVFPGRRIVCGLLFTDGPRLLRLSDGILDRQWADMASRLQQDGP